MKMVAEKIVLFSTYLIYMNYVTNNIYFLLLFSKGNSTWFEFECQHFQRNGVTK